MEILTTVVPRLEAMKSWTEDDLVADLHEVIHDLGVSQKTFMTILRHALSGMKVCTMASGTSLDAYCRRRRGRGWQKSWRLLEKKGVWLVYGVEQLCLEYEPQGTSQMTNPGCSVPCRKGCWAKSIEFLREFQSAGCMVVVYGLMST